MEVNDIQNTVLTDKVNKYYNGDLQGKHFALWGLAFKPETDDIREAPALYVIDALLDAVLRYQHSILKKWPTSKPCWVIRLLMQRTSLMH